MNKEPGTESIGERKHEMASWMATTVTVFWRQAEFPKMETLDDVPMISWRRSLQEAKGVELTENLQASSGDL